MKQTVHIRSLLSSLFRRLSRNKAPSDPAAFRTVFDRFKNVLESNNRALETITDMGEKLGGDYLFDSIFVREAYSRLKGDMEYSLDSFHELTRGRYPQLQEVFQHIDSLVHQMIYDASPLSRELVLFLEDIPWGSAREVGGKNAALAEVKNQLGLHVPEGFVITTTAFDEFIRYNQLTDHVSRLQDNALSSDSLHRELRDRIMQGTIPPVISHAIEKALGRMQDHTGGSFLAIRSSAEEEDSSHSFAGQFITVLNVPLELEAVEQAYREVIASLYSVKAIAYQQQRGFDIGTMKMAVGCMVMVDAVSSGVIYSTTPEGDVNTSIISAAWGLGETVVESKAEADLYVVRKGKKPAMVRATYGKKDTMVISNVKGGTSEIKTPDKLRGEPTLLPKQISALTRQAMAIESYFGTPRDIEWAIDKKGAISILQARSLNAPTRDQTPPQPRAGMPVSQKEYPLLMQSNGTVVQRGTGAGKVFIVKKPVDGLSCPKGAVLVAKHDSSLFVRIMPYVSAIITETGSQTSHMAALSRELKLPTIVNVPHALEILQQGQDITLVAGDDNQATIYKGIIHDLLVEAGQDARQIESVFEFRRKRYILRYISPLHLIDPFMDEFTPERCRTMHDILRFIHEKSVAELVETARQGDAKLKKQGTVTRLELPVPAGILVMDMGGGLQPGKEEGKTTFDQITSIPFKAIVKGMIHPGTWHSDAVALKAQDLLSSMMRMPDIENVTASTAGFNVAVISREYMNMSIRFGYHFNMVDCYCSENARNNHVYFRFTGGATDLVKRSRRLALIARILKEYGYTMKIKGDLLIARLAGLNQEEMVKVLDQTGRLISFARQLDATLQSDQAVERYARNFLEGVYVV